MWNTVRHDMFNFFVMFLVVMIAFSSGFFTLYKDPTYHADADMMDRMECIDYDDEMGSFFNAFVILMEAMLAQDGEAKCFRTTSQPVVGTAMMYMFMLTGVIMMVNTLIAMMAKTFDQFSSSGSLYLFLKARTAHDWEQAEAAAPPLNLLSIPYSIAVTISRILHSKRLDENGAAQGNRFRLSNVHRRWLYLGSVEDLAKAVSKFAREHSGQSMSKRMESISLTREVGRLKFMLNYQHEKLVKIAEQQKEVERSVERSNADLGSKLDSLWQALQQQGVARGGVQLEAAQPEHNRAPETTCAQNSAPATPEVLAAIEESHNEQPADIEGDYDSLRVEIDYADFLAGGSMGATLPPNKSNCGTPKDETAQIHYSVPCGASRTVDSPPAANSRPSTANGDAAWMHTPPPRADNHAALPLQKVTYSSSPSTHQSFMYRLAGVPAPVCQGSAPLMKRESFRRRDSQMWEDVAPSPTRASALANRATIDRSRGGKMRSEEDSWVD